MQVPNIQLLIQESAKGIVDIGFSLADRFDLGAQQLQPGRVLIQYMVFKISFFIFYVDILVHHSPILDCKYAKKLMPIRLAKFSNGVVLNEAFENKQLRIKLRKSLVE